VCRDVYVSVYIEYCMLSYAAYLGHDYWALLDSSTMLKVLFRLDNQAESSFFDIRHCLALMSGYQHAELQFCSQLQPTITNGLLCCVSNWSML